MRQAVLRLATGRTGTVQVLPVADPVAPPGFERFLSAAIAASGQSAREVEQAQAFRRETVERVASGRRPETDETGALPDQATKDREAPNRPVRPTGRSMPAPSPRQVASPVGGRKRASSGEEPRLAEISRTKICQRTTPSLTAGTVAEDGSLE